MNLNDKENKFTGNRTVYGSVTKMHKKHKIILSIKKKMLCLILERYVATKNQ